jgi:orotate phosphoribosyltransferase
MSRTAELLTSAQRILFDKAVLRFDEPIELASGKMSKHFVDGKAGLAQASDLKVACEAVDAVIQEAGIAWDAVGGLTLGADHIAVGVAMVADKQWFFIRKATKTRGTGKRIEGADLAPGVKVLLVEDVVSTGGSMIQALDAVLETGAEVVAAATLIDRGNLARPAFESRGVPFFCLGTYEEMGLPPVGED